MNIRIRKRYVVGAILSLIVIYAGWKMTPAVTAEDATVALLPTITASIETQAGPKSFVLEVADEPVELEVGLMHRKRMEEDHGMVFLFGRPARVVSFWMKNTLIPLDMLFIDENGIIVDIHHRAKPGDLTPITSKAAVITVVEINGGLAEKYGIKPGDAIDLSEAIPTVEK